MRIILSSIIIFQLMLSGCATLYEECAAIEEGPQRDHCQLEVRDYRRGIDIQNWEICLLAYEQAHQPTLHEGHVHRRKESYQPWVVRDDLRSNKCRSVINKKYWAEY